MKQASGQERHSKLFQLLHQQSNSALTAVRISAKDRALMDESDATAFREIAISSWNLPAD